MTRYRSFIVVIAAVLTLSVFAGVRAHAQQTSEARIQDLVRQATDKVLAAGQAGATAIPRVNPMSSPGPVMNITLDDAVKDALDHNLDIAVQRLNPQVSDIAISTALAAYNLNLSSNVSQQSTNNPSQQTTQGASAGTSINQSITTYNGTVTKPFQKGGGTLAANINNNRQTTSSTTALFDPAYNTNWSANYTQPLLRNFKIDTNRMGITVAKVNRDISDVSLRATITNTVANVRNAYWDYVYAQAAVEVAQQTLDLAHKLVQDNQTRVEVGTMAPIDVTTALAEEANDTQALVAAQATKRTTEQALKKLIVGGTDDPIWNASINATDKPDFNPQPVDLEAAIRRALAERTDLDSVKKNEQINDVTLKYLNDQLKPQLDLNVRYGLVGQGGTSFITSGTGITRQVIGTIPGGYSDALSSLLKNKYPTWTVGLTASYPIGTSSQETAIARSKVQLNQIDAQLKQIELNVANDVTNAFINLTNTAQAVQASNASVELAQKKLDAEQSKFDVGMSTNYNVVQFQRDLASSRNSQLSAIRNYRKAQVEFERLQQTTLSSSNITILGR